MSSAKPLYFVLLVETDGDSQQQLPYSENYAETMEYASRLKQFLISYSVHLYESTESWDKTDEDGVPVDSKFQLRELPV